MYKPLYILVILLFLLSGSIRFEDGKRKLFNTQFDPDKVNKTQKVLVNFQDSIPDDTLTVYFDKTDFPIAFSRDIFSPVCMDTLCRPVDITIFWEITGKYLGYIILPGDELTKKKHTPFLQSDYVRLNEILADSSSQLGFYTPEEMHPKQPVTQTLTQTTTKTDGITGATPPDISSWIVPEAAYTSYALWHLTYGSTRDSVMAFTKNNLLTNQLLINILQAFDPYGQAKALQWIIEKKMNRNQFIELAYNILHIGNYQSSVQALKFLKKCDINQESLQMEVIKLFDSEDFRIKNLANEYIRESEKLTKPVVAELITRLNIDNYYSVNVILSLLEKRVQPDQEDQVKLCELLNSKNVNVANRVYYFLLNLSGQSSGIVNQLNRYRRKNL